MDIRVDRGGILRCAQDDTALVFRRAIRLTRHRLWAAPTENTLIAHALIQDTRLLCYNTQVLDKY